MNRREFLQLSAASAGTCAVAGLVGRPESLQAAEAPESIRDLKPMLDGIVPITSAERSGRLEKARELMLENGIDALYLEPGSSLFYYTGFQFHRSERMTALVVPSRGKIAYILPKFEEDKAREMLQPDDDVRLWEEHESPYKLVAQVLRDRKIAGGKLGIEENVRFFLTDGIRSEAPQVNMVNATVVTAGCRMRKSEAELSLMQRANDITIVAYKAAVAELTEGSTQHEFAANCRAAFTALGVKGGIFAQFGKYTAFPHGSSKLQHLKEGEVALMDGGCSVEGYRSDISRTFVFGKATQRQRAVWDLERKAQDVALAAAKPGVPCEAVDAAARTVITQAGFGSDYEFFSHRVGHGIGLDGHEWTYLVRGNRTLLAPGMCFSDEPGIYIKGEFGVRLEDCMHITDDGARLFTEQSPDVERPFG